MTVDKNQVHAAIRQAGGIVHSDGNIFFTNAEMFLAAAARAMPEQQAGPTDDERAQARAIGLRQHAAMGSSDEWERAQAICDLPAVDEAIRNLLEDNTGDNATCLVREVMRAALSAKRGMA